METERPLIGVTIGDPAGIGPEVVLGALQTDPGIYDLCRPVVIGDLPILQRAAATLGLKVRFNRVENPAAGRFQPDAIDLLDMETPECDRIETGLVQATAGAAAFAYMKKAIELSD